MVITSFSTVCTGEVVRTFFKNAINSKKSNIHIVIYMCIYV